MGRTALATIVTRPRLVVVLAAVVAALAAAAPSGATTRALTEVRTAEAAVLERVNEARRSRGLRALRLSAGLARAADSHARAMGSRGFFSHTSRDGTSMGARIGRFYSRAGHSSWTVGEVIAWRSPSGTAAKIVAMWLASPGHRRILLHGAFREIGIAAIHAERAPGVYGNREVTIFVADLGARS
jgi:uncharacterized protein YkwD